MLAYLVVTDAPYFGRTDGGRQLVGRARPRGRYRVTIWHPRLRAEGARPRARAHGRRRRPRRAHRAPGKAAAARAARRPAALLGLLSDARVPPALPPAARAARSRCALSAARSATDWELEPRHAPGELGRRPLRHGRRPGAGALRPGRRRACSSDGRASRSRQPTRRAVERAPRRLGVRRPGPQSPPASPKPTCSSAPTRSTGYRLRVKAGAFYAPVSLENRASRLGFALHALLLRHRQLAGRRGAHDRASRPSSTGSARAPGHAFDLGRDRRRVRLERRRRRGARRRRLHAHRPPDPCVRARRPAGRAAAVRRRSPSAQIDGRAGAYAGLERATSTVSSCGCCATTTAPTRRP